MYDYKIIKSNRKSISIQITKECTVLVRAPKLLPKKFIDDFVSKHDQWIAVHLEKQQKINKNMPQLTDAEITEMKRMAKEYILPKVEEYSKIMGLSYSQVKITSAKTRYGSCNTKNNNLCFSYLLMNKPYEAIDYVIVHELAHIVHHNHSKDFYLYISRFMPDYKKREKILKSV